MGFYESGDVWDFPYRTELENTLDKYSLSKDEICLHGSLILQASGIRENNDIDLILTPEARRSLPGIQSRVEFSLGNTVSLSENVAVSSPNKFDWLDITDEEIVHNKKYHTTLDGFKLLRPELYLQLKYYKGREKDHRDIQLIQEHLIQDDDWNWGLVSPPAPWNDDRFGSTPLERVIWAIRANGVRWTVREALLKLHPANRSEVMATLYKMDCFSRDGLERDCWRNTKLDGYYGSYLPVAYVLSQQYDDREFSLSDLFNSFSSANTFSEGTIHDSSISLNSEVRLTDNVGELKAAVRNGTEFISVNYHRKKTSITSDDSQNSTKQQKDIFSRYGVYFYFVIWPAAADFSKEITDDIRESTRIVSTRTLNLDKRLPDFVRALYETDGRAYRWKIEKKIDLLSNFEGPITLVTVEIPEPDFRIEDGVPIAKRQAALKKKLRKQYSERIDQYEYDILLHATDNFRDNRNICNTLRTVEPR